VSRQPSRWRWFFTLFTWAAAAAVAAPFSASAPADAIQAKKPSISLRANPSSGFSPLRVVVTAEVKGGANDYEDFYCASVEWDWGDGTKSESKADCDPYEAGKSEITRRFIQEHTFRSSGIATQPFGSSASPDISGNQPPVQCRIKFTLKQKSKTVGSGQTSVEIRPGLRDGGLE
jgi:hypothetical protein